MRTPVYQRQRFASQKMVAAGGMRAILNGLFGSGSPAAGLAQEAAVRQGPVYHFHIGDLFTPGTGNYVLDPKYETPLNTIWGFGFLRVPNTFRPVEEAPLVAGIAVPVSGIGGVVAGQIITQPLSVPEGS